MKKISILILAVLATSTVMAPFAHARHGNHHNHNNNKNNNNTSNDQKDQESSNTKPQSSSSNSDTKGGKTNRYDIKVTYKGTHDVGQKLDGGKIVQDPGKPYGTIACGDIAPNELMGGKSSNAGTFEMPAKQHTITIPKGSIPAQDGEYYILDEKGKFVRDSSGKFKTEKGPFMKCNYSFIGQGGFLGIFSSENLVEITIGDTPEDSSFKYANQ